jgi:hypothetical protein
MSEDIATAIVKWFNSNAYDGRGWYYYDEEYPEEGSVGSFKTREEAENHALKTGYEVNYGKSSY